MVNISVAAKSLDEKGREDTLGRNHLPGTPAVMNCRTGLVVSWATSHSIRTRRKVVSFWDTSAAEPLRYSGTHSSGFSEPAVPPFLM